MTLKMKWEFVVPSLSHPFEKTHDDRSFIE
jgi:hypothetical protein